MKIGLLSTPWIKVPPTGYGGAEWVVSHLAEGLVKKGHDVTLFATGDSKTSAKLLYAYQNALGNDVHLKLNVHNTLNHYYHFMKTMAKEKFDIIHSHAGRSSQYFMELQNNPFLYTMHGNYTSKNDLIVKNTGGMELFEQFKHHPYVSISKQQEKSMPGLNYIGTVYNGIILNDFIFSETGGDTISWLGRVTPNKGLDKAMQVALNLNKKVMFGGWVDTGDKEYYDASIQPYITQNISKYIGEIKSTDQKSQLFGKSRVLLYPLEWEEPFGLVMVEAMATGTPVVAYAQGSVPEIIKDGETGFIVNASDDDIRGDFIIKKTGLEGLTEAVQRIYSMSPDEYLNMRKANREHIKNNFTVERMVDEYEKIYLQRV